MVFATKPELGRRMVVRALDAQVPARWVTADEVYGSDSRFRGVLEERSIGYVVAVSCQQRLFLGMSYGRADQHAASLPKRAWRKLSCGAGSKGERFYDWAFLPFPFPTEQGLARGLLVRRSREDENDFAYYLTHASQGTPLKTLVKVVNVLPSYRMGPPKLANQMLPSRSSRILRKITGGIRGNDLSAIGVKNGSG